MARGIIDLKMPSHFPNNSSDMDKKNSVQVDKYKKTSGIREFSVQYVLERLGLVLDLGRWAAAESCVHSGGSHCAGPGRSQPQSAGPDCPA